MEEMDFIIDTNAADDAELLKVFNNPFPIFSSSKYTLGHEEDDEADEESSNEDYYGLPPPSIRIKDALESCPVKLEDKNQTKGTETKTEKKFNDNLLNALDDYLCELQPKQYSFVTDGIESKRDITHLGMSENQLKRKNRIEREKTKGANWFNMTAPEVTEELKNDIAVLQMRSALDPKHFYKRNEMKTVPKYFEMGQVIESPVEYHNSKDVRKTKKSLVDELLEDAQFQKYNKRKFQETVELKKQTGFNKAMKKMRKLKKKRA